MSVDNFKPAVWSSAVLSNLNKNLVYAQDGIINTSYEGDISQYGDSVRINRLGRVTVADYDQATGLGDPEQLTSEQQTLLIDQQKSFNFMIGDIDGAQTRPKLMAEATQEAAYALADAADQHVAGLYTSAGKTIGSDAEPETVDATNAYDMLVDLSVLLSEKSTKTVEGTDITVGGVPTASRWVVVSPSFHGKLRKDSRFIHATSAGDEVIRNGEVGRAAGFRVLMSNNVPHHTGDGGTTTTSNDKIIAGHPMAWTYAEQINKTEAYRPDKFFSDALRGLHLYGAKVTRPEALAVLSVATA